MNEEWDETLNHAIESFGGQAPHQTLEAYLANQHAQHPAIVRAAINRIADSYANGTVRSPWGVLKTELEKRAAVQPKVKASTDQAKAHERAEQWIHSAGFHYDRVSELHDELYGDRGTVRQHPATEPTLTTLWADLQPARIKTETDQQTRLDHWRAHSPLGKRLPQQPTDLQPIGQFIQPPPRPAE
jgi:hypothetical protein